MARFVDLEESGDDEALGEDHVQRELQIRAATGGTASCAMVNPDETPGRPPTISNVITEAFSCYPIVIAIVSSIDLTTLDALARTSRAIHNGLVQFHDILLASTLRCSNDSVPVDGDQVLRYRARASSWRHMEDGHGHRGKYGSCARDMVDECRRCGHVVCRNCAMKAPAPVALRERHRRLCVACSRAPIPQLLHPPLDAGTSVSSEAVRRAICRCDSAGVWLCLACGRNIRGADHEYQRIWRWRNQYGEALGGLGTGIGDGDRGVICGREQNCLAARDLEQEIDCDAEDVRDTGHAPWHAELPSPASPATTSSMASAGTHGSPFGANTPITSLMDEFRHENERTPSPQHGPGYERHEIEGIGGRVKRKLVRIVRVGACVPERIDEQGCGGDGVLAAETTGIARSWCGWCWRVIPGRKDIDGGEESCGGGGGGGSPLGDPSHAGCR
ncbi:hypothetical protein DCS_01709 [Drechmeria coniospora]|uniref:Sulfate transporter protein n=1 Tax=Drechmeria coniospora TaxID=98403 RepID=A0A151GU82_DRECN|nr:hypothetical protein DCS_01709 [Drechmeria coniospora]KYK60572.1 hypothetical protein DCS_01709 [Drechmeria coniospora]ODA80728.1 hypothetical protein RJ55_03687 [Drechmeria coniospora]